MKVIVLVLVLVRADIVVYGIAVLSFFSYMRYSGII